MTRRERDLRRLADDHGWGIAKTKRHWRLRHPDGPIVIVAATPGDSGWKRVILGCMRRELEKSQP
jgi:hypothetical protein